MAFNVWDNALGFDAPSLSYEGWLIKKAVADKAAADAAAKQAAAAPPPAPAPAPAPVAAPAPAPAPAPVAPTFDPSPFRSLVDQGFSQFTPEFYANQYAAAFNPYKVGLEGQYGAAKDTLTAGLAKKGLANSQQGRGLFQQLDALKNQAETTGQQAAQNYQTSLSSGVQSAKDALYGSIGEGADNASIGTRAAAAAAPLYGSKAPAPALSDIFGNLVTPYASAASPGGPVNPNAKAFATGENLNLAGGAGGPEASTKVVATKKKKF